MKVWTTIADGFSRWIDSTASFIVSVLGQFASPRTIKLVEGENGEFIFQSMQALEDTVSTTERIRIADGRIVSTLPDPVAAALRDTRIEVTLKPDRFLFRPFELPGRAAEFLDGIVRAQIDRLTPWNATEAAFGWSKPNNAGAERITVTVAATARALIAPYVQAIASFGVQSIAVFTVAPEHDTEATPIKVVEERYAGSLDVTKIRHMLTIILVAAGVTAAAAVGGSAIDGLNLDAQKDELAQRIAKLRAAAGASNNGATGSIAAAQLTLESRKHTAPSSVMIVETLSRILPDHTYVTELRIEDNKIQLVGVTHDAPSLIGLIEQSGLLTHATFFAPTTRSPSDPGERFHIEALIQPAVARRS